MVIQLMKLSTQISRASICKDGTNDSLGPSIQESRSLSPSLAHNCGPLFVIMVIPTSCEKERVPESFMSAVSARGTHSSPTTITPTTIKCTWVITIQTETARVVCIYARICTRFWKFREE
jgi:hypothetical protein